MKRAFQAVFAILMLHTVSNQWMHIRMKDGESGYLYINACRPGEAPGIMCCYRDTGGGEEYEVGCFQPSSIYSMKEVTDPEEIASLEHPH